MIDTIWCESLPESEYRYPEIAFYDIETISPDFFFEIGLREDLVSIGTEDEQEILVHPREHDVLFVSVELIGIETIYESMNLMYCWMGCEGERL